MGDLNAHTGELSVTIENNDPGANKCHDAVERYNCDKIINQYGKLLINFCLATEHKILNGRFVGDSLGFHLYE